MLQFRHRVVKADPVEDEEGNTLWNVTVKDCENECVGSKLFDAVIVCNG